MAASMLERFEKLNKKISLELNVTDFANCKNYVHLLLILAKKQETRQKEIDLFREIYIDCEELSFHNFSPNNNTEKYLILLSM